MNTRPNLLVLMPDQWRADCLSCAGHPVVRTPNVDRLAAEGQRFTRAYTPCPICMPARSSFLSGQFPHNHGQWWNYGSLPATADTYPHRLRSAGYHTCHIGKSHLYVHDHGRHLREYEPFMNALGWDDVLETTGPHATRTTESILTDHWRQIGCLDTFREDYNRRAAQGFLPATWPSPLPLGETMDDFVGRTACEYLAAYQRAEPWLLFVGFGGPHEPWDAPRDWAARYEGRANDPAQPPSPAESWLTPAAAAHRASVAKKEHPFPPEVVARIRALYYAKISHVDEWIGRLMATVEQRGWADNTAVVFWSDHGEMLGDRALYHKMVFYEPSARVPLILRVPGRDAAGTESSRLTSLVDVFPTLLSVAGCAPREREFGRSLLGPGADVVCSEIDHCTMIRDNRYKLVVDSAGEALMLYDLQDDPGETCNLVGRSDAEVTLHRLQQRLGRWLQETHTEWKHFHRT